jgi:hypothetical protein
MLTKASFLNATRKSIIDHCCSFIVSMIFLWVLVMYKEEYPFNYMILVMWLLALIASVPPACLIILSNQGRQENLSDEALSIRPEIITLDDISEIKLVEIVKYCSPNYSLIRDKLTVHKNVLSRAAILTLGLSISSILLEIHLNFSISSLSSSLFMFRSAVSFWWTYSLLCGLRFGGYNITESQHRSAHRFNVVDCTKESSKPETLSFSVAPDGEHKLTASPVS